MKKKKEMKTNHIKDFLFILLFPVHIYIFSFIIKNVNEIGEKIRKKIGYTYIRKNEKEKEGTKETFVSMKGVRRVCVCVEN